MRGFVWISLTTAALVSASCVVGIDDVESKGNGVTGGASGSDASVGGSSGASTGGASTGGASTGGVNAGGAQNGGTSGDGGNATGGNAGSPSGGSGGSAATGGSGGSVSGGGTGGTNPCPFGMVSIVGNGLQYCIDSTEVTQSEYAKLLTGAVPTQTDPCSNNKLDPECPEFNPVAYPNRPAVCVDWCDARTYCQSVGKRLCGKIGGGTADPGTIADANSDEWYRACSKAGSQKYPYGQLYASGTCNDISAPTTSPVNVAFYPQCVGGYPNLFDMSGNVREWEAACNVNGCYARGGAYLDLQDNVACTSGVLTVRTAATKELGFRCCSD